MDLFLFSNEAYIPGIISTALPNFGACTPPVLARFFREDPKCGQENQVGLALRELHGVIERSNLRNCNGGSAPWPGGTPALPSSQGPRAGSERPSPAASPATAGA